MSRIAIAIAATALFPLAAPLAEENGRHAEYLASIATYKPLQGFSHTVGERHFVGFFVVAEGRCRVTVIDATAGDDPNFEAPRRRKFELRAGGSAEIKADHGKALGVGCTADANEITVIALEPSSSESASR